LQRIRQSTVCLPESAISCYMPASSPIDADVDPYFEKLSERDEH
jgi:hypothetical protein